MTLTFEVGERFVEAADEWAERRMTDREDALETKVEQALLEIEHVAAGAHEVDFEVDGRRVTHEPSEGLAALLDEQAEATGLSAATLLKLHVDLYARAFLREATETAERPPNAPPRE